MYDDGDGDGEDGWGAFSTITQICHFPFRVISAEPETSSWVCNNQIR